MSDFVRQEPIGLEKPKSLLFFDESKVKRDAGKFAKKEGSGAEEKPEGSGGEQSETIENVVESYRIAVEEGEMDLDQAIDDIAPALEAEGIDPEAANAAADAFVKEMSSEGDDAAGIGEGIGESTEERPFGDASPEELAELRDNYAKEAASADNPTRKAMAEEDLRTIEAEIAARSGGEEAASGGLPSHDAIDELVNNPTFFGPDPDGNPYEDDGSAERRQAWEEETTDWMDGLVKDFPGSASAEWEDSIFEAIADPESMHAGQAAAALATALDLKQNATGESIPEIAAPPEGLAEMIRDATGGEVDMVDAVAAAWPAGSGGAGPAETGIEPARDNSPEEVERVKNAVWEQMATPEMKAAYKKALEDHGLA